ncbi:juvenile hormone esterase [Plodia interpunctella]|uniref:juvenile hormone esterase n=1 Tax=Plodia interpunctella TaxID=58824 RepID=UPI002367B3B2|nr:juvenile hormone esterase-like [Plodia interpunctella]
MFTVCVLVASVLAGSTASSPKDGPVTVTPSGSIRGSWLETRRGRAVQAYRGIRYAEPPVGELRFQPPKPIVKYDKEVDASQEGPACPQPTQGDYYVDEDCLRINVYTPDNKSKKPLPVIFYMHSGGFYSISGRSDVAGPLYLLDKDVVLVTINYRLASLGFLSTGDDLAPGNNGFKDQVVALRWVHKNIRSFGGDPNKVTISGCSAGSFSVMLHMISPMSKGLFHRALSISGSPISQVADRRDMYALAVKQAQLLNCPTNSSRAIIDCLKTKTFTELGNSLEGFFLPGYDPVLVWSPVVEKDFGQERFLTMSPGQAVKQGEMHAVPFIISQTQGEFFWKAYTVLRNKTILDSFNADWRRLASVGFLLGDHPTAAERLKAAYLNDKRLENNAAIADGLGKLYGDSLIGFGVHRMANLMSRHSPHKVWYYEFSYVGQHSHYQDPTTGKPEQAAHHDDLIYLFSLPASFPTINATDSEDSKMVDKMTTMVYNFALQGDPNPPGLQPELPGLHWPAMTPSSRKYLRVDKQLSVHENLFEDRFKIWEELFPMQY